MAFAESNRVRISYSPETVEGVTDTDPVMQIMRVTSSDFAANKQTQISDELRSDRQVSDMSEVAFDSNGTPNIEMSLGGSFDTLIQAALAGTYTTALPAVATGLDVVAATSTVTDSDSSGAFTNAVEGQWVYFANYADAKNNGWHKIATINSIEEVVLATLPADLVDETGTGTQIASGKTLTNGIIKRSFSVEQGFLDIEVFQLFRYQRVGTWALSISAGSIITGSIGFQGGEMGVEAQTGGADPSWLGTGSYAPATVTPVVNATSNVGVIMKDGAVLSTALQSIDIALDNALRNQAAVSNKFPVGIGYGRATISGSVSAYFEDLTLYQAMLDHDDVSLAFSLSDGLGNEMHIEYPRIKLGSSTPAPGGIDQDVMEDIDWTAIVDSNGVTMRVDIV